MLACDFCGQLYQDGGADRFGCAAPHGFSGKALMEFCSEACLRKHAKYHATAKAEPPVGSPYQQIKAWVMGRL
jgi:hypothetical protein